MPEPTHNLGFLLNDVARLLRRNFVRRAQHHGLSLAQWQALAHLSRREGVKQVTLAEGLEIQPITLGRLIDRLEEAGLVTRRPDPGDRRAFRLYLTEAAQPLMAEMWGLAAETRGEAMDGLSEAERLLLVETLERMKLNLLAAEGAAAEPEERDSRAAGHGD